MKTKDILKDFTFNIQRFASKYNTRSSTLVSGTSSNDYIYNYYNADNVTIDAGGGNDTIQSYYASYNRIDAGAGNDSISVYSGTGHSINAGDGNDIISLNSLYISAYYGKTTVRGGKGNDILYGNNQSIVYQYSKGDGYDKLYNFKGTLDLGGASYAKKVQGTDLILEMDGGAITIVGGASTSSMYNFYISNGVENYAKAAIAGGKNTVNSSYSAKVTGTAYDDTIHNKSSYDTIDAGEGNDNITVEGGYHNSINGGAGNDKISISGTSGSITVKGGEGNDTIYADKNIAHQIVYQYSNYEGNDVIYGFKDNDSLALGSMSYWTVQSGNDLIYNVGSGSITLKDYKVKSKAVSIDNIYAKKTLDSATESNDTIKNSGASLMAYGYGGNDSVYNSGSYVTIDAGAGNDTINNSGHSTYINAGDGNDSIYNSNSYVTINGGLGNDVISLSSSSKNVTVNGGTGNDTIYGYSKYGVYYQYYKGDGNDIIYGFKDDDSLKIDAASYTSVQSGNDLIYNVGSNTITLKNYKARQQAVYIPNSLSGVNLSHYATDFNDTIYTSGSTVTAYGKGGNDQIINNGGFYVTIDGGNGNDSIENSSGNLSSIVGGEGDDVINNSGHGVSLDGGAGNDTILSTGYVYTVKGGAGNDYISIKSGASAGGDVTNVYAGEGNDTIYGYSNYKVSYQYYKGDGNDTIYGFKDGDTLEIVAYNGYTSIQSGNDLIYNVGSNTITLKDYKAKPENLKLDNRTNYSVVSGGAGNDSIYNRGACVTINAGEGNDTINAHGQHVKIYAGEGNDSVTNYDNYDVSINSGAGNDYISLRSSEKVTVISSEGNDLIDLNSSSKITISGGEGDDTINDYYGSYNSIDGGAGNDKISLTANRGSITVTGGKGNDTIFLKSANYGITYQYAYGDGSDVINNFGINDKISIAGDSQYTYTKTGTTAVISVVGSGEITINNVRSTNVSIVGGSLIVPKKTTPTNIVTVDENENCTIRGQEVPANYTSYKTISGTNYNDTLKNFSGENVTIQAGAGNDSIYNSGRNASILGGSGKDNIFNCGCNVTINGGSGNDSIYTNYGHYNTIDGGEGNDTIYSYAGRNSSIHGGAGDDSIRVGSTSYSTLNGGSGNDTLTGGYYGNIFVYESGNDVITNYAAGNDKIKLSSTSIIGSSISGNDVILKTNNGSITVQNGRYKNITVTDSSGYTTTKTYSNYNAKTLDLLYDNNFMTAEFGIDEITEQKFEVQNIQTQNNSNLTQVQNILTYGTKK